MDGPRRADLSRPGRLQSHESAPLRATGKAQMEDATYTDKEDGYTELLGFQYRGHLARRMEAPIAYLGHDGRGRQPAPPHWRGL